MRARRRRPCASTIGHVDIRLSPISDADELTRAASAVAGRRIWMNRREVMDASIDWTL